MEATLETKVADIYNRQNELYIFLKQKVHFFQFFAIKMSSEISPLLIFYYRTLCLFQRLFKAISNSFQCCLFFIKSNAKASNRKNLSQTQTKHN